MKIPTMMMMPAILAGCMQTLTTADISSGKCELLDREMENDSTIIFHQRCGSELLSFTAGSGDSRSRLWRVKTDRTRIEGATEGGSAFSAWQVSQDKLEQILRLSSGRIEKARHECKKPDTVCKL